MRALSALGALMLALAPARKAPAQPSPPVGSTLAGYSDHLNWDPVARGPLLIVSPEATMPAPSILVLIDGAYAQSNPAPGPDADGNFSVNAVADYFSRKLVAFDSMAVFAPTTMMRLIDATHLKSPNVYATLTGAEVARLFESTLSADQWQRLCSADGIGIDDLSTGQRSIFEALLPEPLTVTAQTPRGEHDGTLVVGVQTTTLSEEQREGVRLSIAKKLDWSLREGTYGSMPIGGSAALTPPGTTYLVAGPVPPTVMSPSGQYLTRSAFGFPLTNVEAARPKPDQLAEALRTSRTIVALDGVDNLGDLVRRIARQTGSELYSDPRYASRSLYLRGSTARAGDLLRALARAVSGTWRHVGPAYVLTDDLAGLGIRHARIADWIGRAGLLAEAARESTGHTIAGVDDSRRAPWSDSDPLRPDDALRAKLDADEKRPAGNTSLFVPLTELPALAQTAIPGQIRRVFGGLPEHYGPVLNYGSGPIPTDGALVSIRTEWSYHIPGGGTAVATNLGNTASPGSTAPPASLVVPSDPRQIAFPRNCPARVLLIDPTTDGAIVDAAREARRAGFTQLWVEASRRNVDLLAGAVRAGAANGLTVRAVVRPLHAEVDDAVAARDVNILGETTTRFARQVRTELHDTGIADYPADTWIWRRPGQSDAIGGDWPDGAAVARLIDHGDYLRCDDPETQKRILADLRRIAAIPGLAGIVLSDAAPPGYGGSQRKWTRTFSDAPVLLPYVSEPGKDPLLRLGYTESMRLAALRKFGVDPIDLSPLPGGDALDLPGPSGIEELDISLPFFRDGGTDPGRDHSQASAERRENGRDAQAAWARLRADTGSAFLRAAASALRADRPDYPIMISSGSQPETNDFYFGSLDAAESLAHPATPGAYGQVSAGRPAGLRMLTQSVLSAEENHALPRIAYGGIPVVVTRTDTLSADSEAIERLQWGLRSVSGWEGVVVDLTQLSPARAASLLRAMPDAAQPADGSGSPQ